MAKGLHIVRQTVLDLAVHAAETTTFVGAEVEAPPNHGGQVAVDISVVGGDADETYDFLVEGADKLAADGGIYESVMVDDDGEDILAPGVRAGQPAGAQLGTIRVRPAKFYRQTVTTDGTTPEITSGTKLTLQDSTRPPATPQDLALT